MQPVVDLGWVRVALETQRDDHKQLADRLESVQELQVQSRASLEARLEALEARVSSELAHKRSMLNVEVGGLQHVLREVTEQLTTLRKKFDEEVASSRSNMEEQITKSVSTAVGLATSDLNTMYKDLATRVSKETENQTNAVQALQAAVAELEYGYKDTSRHCSKDSTVTLPPSGNPAPSPKAATAEMQEDDHHSVQQLAQQLAEMVNPIERMAVTQRSSSRSRGASRDIGISDRRNGGASTPRASAQEAEAFQSGDCTPAAAYRSSIPQEGALPGALAKGKTEDIKKGLEQLVFLLQDSLEQEAFTWKTEMASIQSGQKSPFQGGHRTPTASLIPGGLVSVSSPTNSTTSGSQLSQRPPSSLSSAPGTGQGTPRASARLSFQVQATSSSSASRETLRNQGSFSSRHSYAPALTSGSRTPSTPGSHASTPASSGLVSVRRRVSSDSGWIRPLS